MVALDEGEEDGDHVLAPALEVGEERAEEGRDGAEHQAVRPQVSVLGQASGYVRALRYVRVCQGMSGYVRVRQDTLGYVRVCQL